MLIVGRQSPRGKTNIKILFTSAYVVSLRTDWIPEGRICLMKSKYDLRNAKRGNGTRNKPTLLRLCNIEIVELDETHGLVLGVFSTSKRLCTQLGGIF